MTIDHARRAFSTTLGGLPAAAALSPMLLSVEAHAQSGNVIVMTIDQSPRHFNAAVQSGYTMFLATSQIFVSPFTVDDKWQIKPYAVESFQWADGNRSLTLKVAPNQKFTDGRPLTSADVAYSIMTIRNNHPFSTMLEPVEKVDTPDASTAIIRLSRPHPALMLALTAPLCPIIPKHVYDDGQDIKNHPRNLTPVGSGPFKLAEFKANEHLVLEKNPDFFIKGFPKADKIFIRVFREPNASVVALERKEVTVAPGFAHLTSLLRLANLPTVTLVDQSTNGVGTLIWIALNTAKKPFDDKRVRQAINYALDKEFIVTKLQYGKPSRALGPITASSPFAKAGLEPYKLNLEKAGKLLDEAGLKPDGNGIRFSATMDMLPGVPEYSQKVAEYVKPQLKKVGIDVTLRASPDFPTWARRVSNHEFDMTTDSVWNWGDPVIGVHRAYLSSNIRKGVIWSNTQSYSNPKVDDLLNRAAVETDPARRKAMYEEFQTLVVEDCPVIYLSNIASYAVVDKKVKGLPSSIWAFQTPLLDLTAA